MFPSLYGLTFAALGIVLQVRHFPIGDTDLETDFYGDLVFAARHLVEGRFSVYDFPFKGPFYALALTLARGITGDWYRGAVVLSAVCGGASLVLAYHLLRRLFDRRVAILSTVTMSLVVEFFVQFHRASTDALFLALCLGSMTLILLAGGSLRRFALAGAVAALAFLTRYIGVFLVAGTFLVLAVANPDRLDRRRKAQGLGLYAGVFVLFCAPWFIANWTETGRILATRNVENITATFYSGPRWQSDPASQIRSLPELITAHPGYVGERYVLNLIDHLRKDFTQLLGWPMWIVPIAGLVGLCLRRSTRRQNSLYLFAAAYWLLTGLVFYAPRFSLPLILPYMVFGLSIFHAGNTKTTRWGQSIRSWLDGYDLRHVGMFLLVSLTAALALVQAQKIVAIERAIHERRPLYILEAAHALAIREPHSRARILARKGHIAYYSGLDYTPYSTNVKSLEDLVRVANTQDAAYVAYSKVEYSLLPRMLFMAVLDSIPLLQEVYREPSIRVFRFTGDDTSTLSDAERYTLLLANLRAARAQRRPTSIYIACSDLASYHLQRRDFAKAAVFSRDALGVAEGTDGGPAMARAAAVARHNLARAQLGLGRPELATSPLQQNLEYFLSSGSRYDVARTRTMLGNAYEIMGRDEEARHQRLMARQLFPQGDETTRADGIDIELEID